MKNYLFLIIGIGLIVFINSGKNFAADSIKTEDYMASMGIIAINEKKKAPEFNLDDLGGELRTLKEFLGRVVFLNFWATWCPPCKEEMPSMEKLYQRFKDRDFVILAVSVDRPGIKVVKPFIAKGEFTFPILLDPDWKTSLMYNIRSIPTTYLIDKKGFIIGIAIGSRDWGDEASMKLFQKLTLGK